MSFKFIRQLRFFSREWALSINKEILKSISNAVMIFFQELTKQRDF